jgi:Transposase
VAWTEHPGGMAGVARLGTGSGPPAPLGHQGAWNYGRGLAQHLVASDEVVYDINPRWTAKERGRTRRTGKTDRLDAHAVALLVWREEDPLPQVVAEDETAVLEVLVTERENALAEATRLRNQLHQLLLLIDPEYRTHLPHLQSKAGLPALETYAAPGTNPSPVQAGRQSGGQGARRGSMRLGAGPRVQPRSSSTSAIHPVRCMRLPPPRISSALSRIHSYLLIVGFPLHPLKDNLLVRAAAPPLRPAGSLARDSRCCAADRRGRQWVASTAPPTALMPVSLAAPFVHSGDGFVKGRPPQLVTVIGIALLQ